MKRSAAVNLSAGARKLNEWPIALDRNSTYLAVEHPSKHPSGMGDGWVACSDSAVAIILKVIEANRLFS
jgi:hypothetical protein